MMVKNKISAILNLTEDAQGLRPLTDNRPIAALPFSGRYRIIDFALSNVAYAGITSVALFIGESGRSIYDHIRSGEAWDLDSKIKGGIFTFSQQHWKQQLHHQEKDHEDFYYNHRLFLERSHTDYVFVAGSNIIANIDIQQVASEHAASGKDVSVIYAPISAQASKETRVDPIYVHVEDNGDTRILTQDQMATAERVNVGLNMFVIRTKKLIELMDQALEQEVYVDVDQLITEALDQLSIHAYEYTGYTAYIDSIDSYYKANIEMLDRQKFSSLLQSSIPILTKGKNGSPAYYADQSNVKESIIGSDSSIYGEVKHSVINRRVIIGDQAHVADSILLQGVHVGEGARVEYAIIDKNTVIEAGAQVVGSPDNILVIGKGSHIKA